jgi:hypothetical protein
MYIHIYIVRFYTIITPRILRSINNITDHHNF